MSCVAAVFEVLDPHDDENLRKNLLAESFGGKLLAEADAVLILLSVSHSVTPLETHVFKTIEISLIVGRSDISLDKLLLIIF